MYETKNSHLDRTSSDQDDENNGWPNMPRNIFSDGNDQNYKVFLSQPDLYAPFIEFALFLYSREKIFTPCKIN